MLKNIGLILFLVCLTGCFYRHSTEIMIVESKKDFFQKAYLSTDNHLCIIAKDRYLFIDLNKEFAKLVGQNQKQVFEISDYHPIKWRDFSIGYPPPKKLLGFSEIPLIGGMKQYNQSSQATHSNVLYLYGEFNQPRRALLQFKFISTERKFEGNPRQEFLIEEPVHFERVYPSFIDG